MVGLIAEEFECDKLIFLDFDGVITTRKSGWTFDDNKLILLWQLLNATDCKIVISSSWRSNTLEETIDSLSFLPFIDRVVGVTPYLELDVPGYTVPVRGMEVDFFVRNCGKPIKYVVLDDCDDFLYTQRDHIIITDAYSGLSENNVEEAIKILNK